MKLYVNGRFSLVPETGVQRYARCISERLRDSALLKPAGLWSMNKRWANLWEQLVLADPDDGQSVLWSPANMGPLLCSRQLLTIHDAAPLAQPRWFSLPFVLWYSITWRWFAFSGAKLCTVSNFSRRELANHLGLAESSIGVIPNGGDHILRLVPKRPEKLRIAEGSQFALVVGSIQPRKNLEVLAKACALPGGLGGVLVVAGGGDSIFAQEKTFSEGTANVVLLGRVSDEELAWLYREAVVLVAPSLYEGFDIPPLEALNLGCPVLLSDIPVHRDIFGDAATYFKPTDVGGLAKTMRSIFTLSVRTAPTKQSRELVERLTWSRATEQAERILSECVGFYRGIVI